jgi:FkbM family methyltransferase
VSVASRVRAALPLRVQPIARFHYERWRGLLERELPVFCGAIHPNDRVVDVGANYGIYTHALRRRGAVVEAFEPQPPCVEVLRAYAAADSAVHVHQVALGHHTADAVLHVPVVAGRAARGSASLMHGAADGDETIPVKVRSLDSFEFADVRAIKIDVEGAELGVIEGAVATIARCRPMLMVEIEQRHHQQPIDRVFSAIAALHYSGQFLDVDGAPRSIAEFRVTTHQRDSALGDGRGTYINNFLFFPTA